MGYRKVVTQYDLQLDLETKRLLALGVAPSDVDGLAKSNLCEASMALKRATSAEAVYKRIYFRGYHKVT